MAGMIERHDDSAGWVSVSVETSGRIGSVAVARGEQIVSSASFNTRHNHGVELLPTVDNLCKQASISPNDIEHVYVSGGPGSFTGLRIGITFAKAMALAGEVKVVRVPTLDVIAQNALDFQPLPDRVVVVLDAKRKNIYSSTFELIDGLYRAIDEPKERDPREYLVEIGSAVAIGEGITYHQEAVEFATNLAIAGENYSRARAEQVHVLGRKMAMRGHFISSNDLIPIYVRRPEAEEKWEERNRTPQE